MVYSIGYCRPTRDRPAHACFAIEWIFKFVLLSDLTTCLSTLQDAYNSVEVLYIIVFGQCVRDLNMIIVCYLFMAVTLCFTRGE